MNKIKIARGETVDELEQDINRIIKEAWPCEQDLASHMFNPLEITGSITCGSKYMRVKTINGWKGIDIPVWVMPILVDGGV